MDAGALYSLTANFLLVLTSYKPVTVISLFDSNNCIGLSYLSVGQISSRKCSGLIDLKFSMNFSTSHSSVQRTQKFQEALDCSELKEAWSMLGYKSELDDLASTVSTVKEVLRDAESKEEELSHEARLWIAELKDAVYDADDLLDEFVTLVKQKKLMKGGKFNKKFRKFFSRFNHLSVAYNMSQGVNKIKKNLDRITNNHTKFGLNPFPCNSKLIRKRREETCSYVNTTDIIGRDADVKKIVGTLLDPNSQQDVSFLSIVGMGGLGKTALAQLVFNDKTVEKEFPLRLWTCVSDQDQFDAKTILAKILASASRQGLNDSSSLDMVVNQLREEIAGRRFLIVLDDVWTKNRFEWSKLIERLMRGNRGSWVLVTTRSIETANIVGNKHVYELQGLSNEYSWQLFQLVAFEQVLDQENSNSFADLINIGQKIVKLCANVPLAIKVVGSLLYGCDKSKWLSIQESGLANLREGDDNIMPILKLSYDNLESPLKSCFSYCALFPKDFEIQKKWLIGLWIAQGFVVPLEKGQSVEDAAEEYFLILLRRSFFQDVRKSSKNKNEIISFKLHDLMHDVALKVSENEICGASRFTGDIDKTVRHVFATSGNYANYSMSKAHIRTYLACDLSKSDVVPVDIALLLANYRRLRALDLTCVKIKHLPASIGKLVHLRYFKLRSDIEYLPDSITDLFNLQTLDLFHCKKLKELPKKFSKLVNLRDLNLPAMLLFMPSGMSTLTFMPSGMGTLTGLYKLNWFVIGEGNLNLKQHVDLEGLKALKNLRREITIEIQFPKSGKFANCDGIRDGAYMRDKEQLYGVEFRCKHEGSNVQSGYEEDLLGALQPHTNLKDLNLYEYRGVIFPRWAKDDILASALPNLVSLSLFNCSELQVLPSLEKLHQLKSLNLDNLPNLEYIQNSHAMTSSPASNGEDLSLPCVETFSFSSMPKLKGWWRRSVNGADSNVMQQTSSVSLLRLKKLQIWNCPEFTCLLYCPNMELLNLFKYNGRLQIIGNKGSHELREEVTPSTSYPSTDYQKLREIGTDNFAWLRSLLPLEALKSLSSLKIGDKEVESLTEFEQVFHACSSSLKSLQLLYCTKLRYLSGGLAFLTCLESLSLVGLPITSFADKNFDGDGEDDEIPWGSLCHSLQYLCVFDCKLLQSFPKWFQKFDALSHLQVQNCPASLYERCQSDTGEDWPNIKHIPRLSIKK